MTSTASVQAESVCLDCTTHDIPQQFAFRLITQVVVGVTVLECALQPAKASSSGVISCNPEQAKGIQRKLGPSLGSYQVSLY